MPKCPQCSEPVSQFAAGCAICGADLEAARRVAGSKPRRRLAVPDLPALPEDALVFGILVLVTVSYPVLGIILALFALTRALTSQRPALWALIILGAVLLAIPATRYGVWLA